MKTGGGSIYKGAKENRWNPTSGGWECEEHGNDREIREHNAHSPFSRVGRQYSGSKVVFLRVSTTREGKGGTSSFDPDIVTASEEKKPKES